MREWIVPIIAILLVVGCVWFVFKPRRHVPGYDWGEGLWPAEGEEWYCTHSGFSKHQILARKAMGLDPCTHDGPCPMDIRTR